jgi:acylglycerol lipase
LSVKVGQFYTEDNLGLYYNYWPAKNDAPCAVYLHGLESHMGWFFNLAEYLNSSGINVYAFDRRGSGLNRDSCKNFCSSYILSDLKAFLDIVKEEHPDSKVFLIGLCLGGKIAVSFIYSYPDHINGLILISPSLKTKLRFSPISILSILFRPNSLLKIPIEDKMFTSNEKYLKHVKKDAMRLHYIPAHHLLEVAKMDRFVKGARRTMHIPVLMMLAGHDDVIDTKSVKRWYEKLPSEDKTIKVYKDFHHILTFEEDANIVLECAAEWICKRSNA